MPKGKGNGCFHSNSIIKRGKALPMSEAEKAGGGGSGDFGHLLDRDSAEGGDMGGDEGDVGTLVAFAAIRDRREVGSVGFQKNTFQGNGGSHRGQSGVLEGHYTADADMETHFDGFVGFLDTATKAVHYPTVGAKIEVAEQTEEFIVCLAYMEAHGKIQFFCPAHLGFEYFPLLLEKGFVPVKVEAYLPYPYVGSLRVEQFLAYQF